MTNNVQICVHCGTEIIEVFVKEGQVLCPKCGRYRIPDVRKRKPSRPQVTRYQTTIAGIAIDESDESLRQGILKSLTDLESHEKGSGLASFAAILSLNPGAQITAMMLKAIVDQNKVIIRQNELLYRAIKERLSETKKSAQEEN